MSRQPRKVWCSKERRYVERRLTDKEVEAQISEWLPRFIEKEKKWSEKIKEGSGKKNSKQE